MRSVYMLCVCVCAREERDLYATNTKERDLYATNTEERDLYATNTEERDLYATNTKERDLYATNTDWARYIGRGAARLDHGFCVRV